MNANSFHIGLLFAITCLYAGYNLFVKVSASYVPVSATSTVFATIILQISALVVSLLFLGVLLFQGGHSFQLNSTAYTWAVVAGVCIGLAEIGYFYLFGGLNGAIPMLASIAIPTIVSGTIVLVLILSVVALREQVGWNQLLGSLIIICGILLYFLPGQTAVNS